MHRVGTTIRPVAVRILLVVGLLALGTSAGCIGDAEPALVTRDDVRQAFAAAGERLEVEIDMAVADPESPVDVIYKGTPEFKKKTGPFGVVVLEDEDAATRHAVSVRVSLSGAPGVVIERHKNLVIVIFPGVQRDRRMRLLDAFQSH